MPEDVDATFDITQQGEAFRQNLLGMAGNLISGQADLDLTRAQTEELTNKVPIEIGGKTFNLTHDQAANFSMAKEQLKSLDSHRDRQSAIDYLNYKMDQDKNETMKPYYQALIEQAKATIPYKNQLIKESIARTKSYLAKASGQGAGDIDLSDRKYIDAIERNLIKEPGNPENQALVTTWNAHSDKPYFYAWQDKKGVFGPDRQIGQVPLPVINGKQIRARDVMEDADILGIPPEQMIKHLQAYSRLPEFNSGVRLSE